MRERENVEERERKIEGESSEQETKKGQRETDRHNAGKRETER